VATERLQERLQERVLGERLTGSTDAGEKAAPVTWLGWQGCLQWPALDLWNLTEEIPGHPVGSTLSGDALRQAGYRVPEPPSPRPEGRPSAITT